MSGRDLRLDFFRGISLFVIFIDHIPENPLSYFTLHSIAFCDAAEVFIFISGYTAALVYGQSLLRNGAVLAVAQVYRRVWQLYVAHIFLFVIFTAEVSYTLVAIQNPMYAEELGVADFLTSPHIAVLHALALDFQPPFLDILPLYIVLLGAFPLILLGLSRHLMLPGIVAAIVYAFALRFGWAPHAYPDDRVWFFNPLTWQVLFVIGASFGYVRALGHPPLRPPPSIGWTAVAISAAIAVISLSWTAHWIYDPFPPLFGKLWYLTLDKTNLAPLRLFSILALVIATLHLVAPEAEFLGSRWARPVILCGQNSLYVFCLGIVLSVLGHFVLEELRSGLPLQMAVNLLGIVLMIATAALLQWFKTASRRSRGPSVQPAPSE